MNHQVELICDPAYEIAARGLTDVALATLRHEAAPAGHMALVLTGENDIHELNRRYRGVDGPTDVLSFPDGSHDPETNSLYFGDVLIAVPLAMKAASERGHALETELTLLAVHGTLHLMGYDHAGPTEKKRMWHAQHAILEELGIEVAPLEIQ